MRACAGAHEREREIRRELLSGFSCLFAFFVCVWEGGGAGEWGNFFTVCVCVCVCVFCARAHTHTQRQDVRRGKSVRPCTLLSTYQSFVLSFFLLPSFRFCSQPRNRSSGPYSSNSGRTQHMDRITVIIIIIVTIKSVINILIQMYIFFTISCKHFPCFVAKGNC